MVWKMENERESTFNVMVEVKEPVRSMSNVKPRLSSCLKLLKFYKHRHVINFTVPWYE